MTKYMFLRDRMAKTVWDPVGWLPLVACSFLKLGPRPETPAGGIYRTKRYSQPRGITTVPEVYYSTACSPRPPPPPQPASRDSTAWLTGASCRWLDTPLSHSSEPLTMRQRPAAAASCKRRNDGSGGTYLLHIKVLGALDASLRWRRDSPRRP